MLLGAIGRVENAVLKPAARKTISSSAFDEHLIGATEGLDRIAAAIAKANFDILEAAEDIQEAAWMLHARGADIALCDTIDRRATDITAACAFQDIAGQQSQRVAEALGLIEERINAMIEILGVDDIAAKGQDAVSQAGPEAAALREGAGILASAALASIAAAGETFAPATFDARRGRHRQARGAIRLGLFSSFISIT